MARPDFRSQAAKRLATERTEYTPALIDLLKPEQPGSVKDVRRMPIERDQRADDEEEGHEKRQSSNHDGQVEQTL